MLGSFLPWIFSSDGNITSALELAEKVNVKSLECPGYIESLKPYFFDSFPPIDIGILPKASSTHALILV
jgi:hypothetical protein